MFATPGLWGAVRVGEGTPAVGVMARPDGTRKAASFGWDASCAARSEGWMYELETEIGGLCEGSGVTLSAFSAVASPVAAVVADVSEAFGASSSEPGSSDLGGSSPELSSSIAESDIASDTSCPICADMLSSAIREVLSGLFSVIEPRRERGRISCIDGRREVPDMGDIGDCMPGFDPDDDALLAVGSPVVSGLRGFASFIEGLRDGAADSTAGVGGPSWPWSSICSRVANSCLSVVSGYPGRRI